MAISYLRKRIIPHFIKIQKKVHYDSVLGIAIFIRGTSKEKTSPRVDVSETLIFTSSFTSNFQNTSALLLCLADHTSQDNWKMFLLLK